MANKSRKLIWGSFQPDNIDGTGKDDKILGLDGDDMIFGSAGDDELMGNAGDDVLVGGPGSDYLKGGNGNDVLIGMLGRSTDYLNGGPGVDTADYSRITYDANNSMYLSVRLHDDGTGIAVKWYKANGEDHLISIENVTGSSGYDRIIGNAGKNVLWGEGGTDELHGGGGADTLDGGLDNDQLYGDAGNDTLCGGDGNDIVDGGGGNDWIQQTISAGDDSLDGGAGVDTLDYSTSQLEPTGGKGVDANLLLGRTKKLLLGGVDTLKDIENVIGTALDDTLSGDAGANVLVGGAGDDTLRGGGGADVLSGDAGNDILVGGAGIDRYKFSRGDGVDTVIESDNVSGKSLPNWMQWAADVASDQLWFTRSGVGANQGLGRDLYISIIGSKDIVIVEDWYVGTSHQGEKFLAGDGKTLASNKINGLVQAMAGLAAPPQGQTALPDNYKQILAPVLASWTAAT